jgi:hypothetical protein
MKIRFTRGMIFLPAPRWRNNSSTEVQGIQAELSTRKADMLHNNMHQ